MGSNNPGATSTPIAFPPIKGRKGIHQQDNSIQSPIEPPEGSWNEHPYSRSYELVNNKKVSQLPRALSTENLQKYSVDRTFLSSETDSDSDDLNRESTPANITLKTKAEETKENNGLNLRGLGILVVVLVPVLLALYFSFPDSSQDFFKEFDLLEEEFSKQEEDFWRNIKVSIQEVTTQDQPRTIIFLYEDKTEATMDAILRNITEVAVCCLTKCSSKAVIIEGTTLNTTEVISDYGTIIAQYSESVETNGVMVVKNLEQVPGISAQAFHSFCDDYYPIVRKALILFTMKVEKLPQEYPVSFVEEILLNLWKDIGKDDKFYPLFTRISGTILLVNHE